jgi:membrane fusion protein (multidrug efflux system)
MRLMRANCSVAIISHLTALADAQTANRNLPAVTVATVRTQDVAPHYRYIGRIEAVQFVDLRARVQGFLQSVDFQEGQQVKRFSAS